MNDLARNYFLSTYAGESRLRHTRAKDRRNPRESRTRQKFVCNWLRKSLCLSCRLGYFLRREREKLTDPRERSTCLRKICSALFVQSELVSV
jgi:hypothetical protein